MSTAGAVLLVQTARVTGLDRLLGKRLAPWRLPLAVHDPGKIVLDLAVAVALGGDCAADIAVVRTQPGLFGPVASDPTVSRLIARLAADAERAQAAIGVARAAAREWVWQQTGPPVQTGPSGQIEWVVIDLDATLVTAHSDKEAAAPTWKGGFGFHPLLGFVDHGHGGTGEPVAELLRRGNAGSNTAADHVLVLEQALAQVPEHLRQPDELGRVAVLVRTDAAGATQEFTRHVADTGMQFSVGLTCTTSTSKPCCAASQGGERGPRPTTRRARRGTGRGHRPGRPHRLADRNSAAPAQRTPPPRRPTPVHRRRWAAGHRIPHPTPTEGNSPTPELRHRRHARVEDRIRTAKDTGLRNLPFHNTAQNHIWLQITALAADLIAWTQRLALTGWAQKAEPKRLRLRIFGVAGRLIRTSHQHWLKITNGWPWTNTILTAHQRLTTLTTT